MTHHGNSFITYFAKKTKLSDIEFMSIKKFDGKMRDPSETNPTVAEGTLAGIGSVCAVTAATGKDLYLARAKLNFRAGGQATPTIELQINGVAVETFNVTVGSNADYGNYQFVQVGHKVPAGQVIRIQNLTADNDIVVSGTIECYDEDTGNSPAI